MNGHKPNSALAVTSLVLGILAVFCLGLIAGIPAIISGHISKSRAAKDPTRYGGAGMALAGLIMGYISFLTTIFITALLAGVLLPALAKAKERAQRIQCVNNLKQVSLGARLYAVDHDGKFPGEFLQMKEELVSPKILICPSDTELKSFEKETEFNAERISYKIVTPDINEKETPPKTVFVRCPIHDNVAYADGSVKGGTRKPGIDRP